MIRMSYHRHLYDKSILFSFISLILITAIFSALYISNDLTSTRITDFEVDTMNECLNIEQDNVTLEAVGQTEANLRIKGAIITEFDPNDYRYNASAEIHKDKLNVRVHHNARDTTAPESCFQRQATANYTLYIENIPNKTKAISVYHNERKIIHKSLEALH